MFFYFLIKGMLIGFALSVIIGPIGVLCIRRSVSEGFLAGFSTGIGAAMADAVYASITAFGVTVISNFLLGKMVLFSVIGGAYLIIIGVRTFMRKSRLSNKEIKSSDLTQDIESNSFIRNLISTFFMTLTNPMTMLLFMTVFAGLNLEPGDFSSSSGLVFGLFCGAIVWWLILSYFGSILKYKLTSKNFLVWLNRVSGIIIILFGILVMLRPFFKIKIF